MPALRRSQYYASVPGRLKKPAAAVKADLGNISSKAFQCCWQSLHDFTYQREAAIWRPVKANID